MLKTVPLLLGLFLLVLSDPDPEPAVYDDPEEERGRVRRVGAF